ncbi:MAG: hypothetical protein NXI24_02035 [bacterium]|nr:hypothetical protein [bacterium]
MNTMRNPSKTFSNHLSDDQTPALRLRTLALPAALALALLIALPLFGRTENNSTGLSISKREMAYLAQCSLSRIDARWVFAEDGPGLVFGRRKIGVFLGGPNGARYDLPFFTCAGQLAGTNWRYINEATDERGLPYGGIASSIADLSGIPLYAPRQGNQRYSTKVNYYNPEIIRWARRNMIPPPKDTVFGVVSYQEIYDEIFARAFHVLHATDVYLREKEAESGKDRFMVYLKLYQAKDYAGRLQLRNEFDAVYRDEYLSQEADPYNYYFSAGHAAGFWLRRGMDGTVDEVRALVREILQKYDPDLLT